MSLWWKALVIGAQAIAVDRKQIIRLNLPLTLFGQPFPEMVSTIKGGSSV